MKKLFFITCCCILVFVCYSQLKSSTSKNELFKQIHGKWIMRKDKSDSVTYFFNRAKSSDIYLNFVDTSFYEFRCRSAVPQMHHMTTCKEKWFFKSPDVIGLQRDSAIQEFRIDNINEQELVLKLIPKK